MPFVLSARNTALVPVWHKSRYSRDPQHAFMKLDALTGRIVPARRPESSHAEEAARGLEGWVDLTVTTWGKRGRYAVIADPSGRHPIKSAF